MMMKRALVLAILPLAIAACSTTSIPGLSDGELRPVDELPEGLAIAAAPHQNLTNLKVQPSDGCYWWEWVGPVETTYLPLVTPDGRNICSRY